MNDPASRPLTSGEVELARSVFGDAIDYLKRALDPFKKQETGISSLEEAFTLLEKK